MEDVEKMDDKRPRKSSPDSADLDEPESLLLTEPDPIEIASGYSISVRYDNEGRPMIYVKRYGDVDTRGLRREIERTYPGAHIQGLESPSAIKMDGKQSARLSKKKPRSRKKPASTCPRPNSRVPTRD